MDTNNLDKMIQDKLGDYRETPDPRVWDRVQTSLDRKKKGRLIPLWFRWGAAAAIILAGLFWLAPRENVSTSTPAVSRTNTQSQTPENTRVENPAAQEPFAGETDDGLAVEAPAYGQTDSEVVSGDKKAADSGPAKSDIAVKGDSGREDPINDLPVASGTAATERTLSNKTNKEDEKAGAREALALEGKEMDAIADSDSDQLKEDARPTGGQETDLSGEKTPKKSIFEAVKAGEEAVADTENPAGRWSVGPSLAPVYFNSFGSGSPISSNFQNNSKSGTLNMSYGLQVSYQLSKKLSVRSGLHRVDYGYNTDDVGFTSSPSARPSSLIRTISYSENSRNLVVHSTIDGQLPPEQPVAEDVSAPSAAREGQMLQEFGYLEIPVEMQYNLLDKKWGINLIGGLSSLFLVENSVSLQSGTGVTEIGEATNMNSLNFSTNLGLGFYYRLNSNLEVNLLPMFKYQLNTFSETSGSFQPYSIGVYSGLNIRF